jgi:hypothetical protein
MMLVVMAVAILFLLLLMLMMMMLDVVVMSMIGGAFFMPMIVSMGIGIVDGAQLLFQIFHFRPQGANVGLECDLLTGRQLPQAGLDVFGNGIDHDYYCYDDDDDDIFCYSDMLCCCAKNNKNRWTSHY